MLFNSSNAFRVVKTPRVFTANEAPKTSTIYFHHELAQTPYYPRVIFFFCEKAAEKNGETPIARSDILWEIIQQKEPQFAKDLLQKGLKYR